LVPFLIKICRLILGDSLRSIRFIPAIATSAAIILTAMIAGELGGRRFALLLSALAFLVAPIYLSDGSLLTTNCLEPLLWMGCTYFVILAIKRNEPRYWLWFGLVAGIGLEEKYSIAVFGFALVVGLLLTEQRRIFAGKWIWLGGAIAFLVFLPNFLWNVQNHWPFLELMRNIKADGRDVALSPVAYFAQQVLIVHPFLAPIWITGLLAFFFSPRFKPYRLFGWCYLAAFTVFVVLKGKNYYLAPIYPVFLAAGAVMIESFIERSRQAWLKPVLLVLLRWSLACTCGHAGSPRGQVHFLHGEAPFQGASQRAQPHACNSPATLCRSVRLGGDGRYRESGLHPALSRGTAGVRDIRPRLRAGGCHRLSWPPLRIASGPQRPPNVFSLGSAGLFRELPDRPRRQAGSSGERIRARRIRGNVGQHIRPGT
jgi:hypothetical protein